MCRWLSGEKPAKCHRSFPPNHVVKLGGGPVSKATGVSFFASGPFPTCYQMSWSSTAEASKSSSPGAATGAANVRKPNTAAPAGRFSAEATGRWRSRQVAHCWFRKGKQTLLSRFVFFLPLSSVNSHKLQLPPMEARLIPILLHRDFWNVCVKFTWLLNRNIQ